MTRIEAGMPAAVVQSSDEVYVDADGELRHGLHVTLPAGNVEQIRQGYRCIMCFAAQPSEAPVECVEPYCRYPIRERQQAEFHRQFGGGEDLWPNRTWESEEAEARAELQAHRARKEGVKVWTPGGEVTVEAEPEPEPEPAKPSYPVMSFDDFQAEPLPKGRWKRRFGS